MQNCPVAVGEMLFTLVDPGRGHEVAYNRWYERDHFYAGCMIGPGWFAGRRWVAPRSLKDLRFPASGPFAEPVEAGSYLALYWLHELDQEAANDWATTQVKQLYADGRGFAERAHAHTAMYLPDSRVNAHAGGVPLELALDHDYPGLAVVAIEPSGGTARESLIDRLDSELVRGLLDGGAVDLVSSWRVKPWPSDHNVPMKRGSAGGTPDRILQLCFLEHDPVKCWDEFHAYAAAVDQSGMGRVTFAAPFIPTVVGTDTYTDELW